jgi:hypothetical protein
MDSEKVENFGSCLEGLMENDEVVIKERLPWEKDKRLIFFRVKKEKFVTSANLKLDKVLLQMLRSKAVKMISSRHKVAGKWSPTVAAAEVSKVMNEKDGETTLIRQFPSLICVVFNF